MKCEICQLEDVNNFHCRDCQRALNTWLDNEDDKRNYAEFIADRRDQIIWVLTKFDKYQARYGIFEDKESAQSTLMTLDNMSLKVEKVYPRSLR